MWIQLPRLNLLIRFDQDSSSLLTCAARCYRTVSSSASLRVGPLTRRNYSSASAYVPPALGHVTEHQVPLILRWHIPNSQLPRQATTTKSFEESHIRDDCVMRHPNILGGLVQYWPR